MRGLHLGQVTTDLLRQPMAGEIARQHGNEEGGSHVTQAGSSEYHGKVRVDDVPFGSRIFK